MKAVVGRHYKLIAAPSMFTNMIGKIFTVTDVSKTEVNLKEKDYSIFGCGYISVTQEEFPLYFELVEEAVKKEQQTKKKTRAGKWSEWKTFKAYGMTYAYKENGKDVVVRGGGYRGKSQCHPDDTFDLQYGLQMAMNRLVESKQKTKKAMDYTFYTDTARMFKNADRDEWWFL